MMPKLSGVDLLAKIKGDPSIASTPVILLSAKALAADVRAGLEAGADDYITKPFEPNELLARVQPAAHPLKPPPGGTVRVLHRAPGATFAPRRVDALTGRVGSECRPAGRVDDPVPLTRYDPNHPYYLAEYDLTDRG